MADETKYRKYAEKIAIFHGLIPEEIDYILHHGKILHFRLGETIFHQGQLGTNLFIVLSGRIAIYDKSKLIAELSVGDAFGEMAVLNRKPRSATAAAITECKLFTLDEKQINQLLEKHVAVRLLMNIIHMLSEGLERANAMITDLRAANGIKTGGA